MIKKLGELYFLYFKKEEGSLLNFLYLFLLLSNFYNNSFILDFRNFDIKRLESFKDYRRVVVKRVVREFKKGRIVGGEDLDSYSDFLYKMIVVVL